MRILDIALKDLTQIFHDKKSLLFLVVMPIAFTIFMGFAYQSGSNSGTKDTRIPLGWVETGAGTNLSQPLFERLETSGTVRPVRMSYDEALKNLQSGQVDGVLIIPDGYELVSDGSGIPQLTLIADTGSGKGQSLYQLLRTPVTQLMSAVEIGKLSASESENQADIYLAFEDAWGRWLENEQTSRVSHEKAVAVTTKTGDWFGDNPYNQASPGILVQFAIFGLVTSAQILVQERKTRTLQRLITTSVQPWEIVAGHFLAMFAITFAQTVMLVIFGQLALHVNYLREPLGILFVTVALGLWVASMGLLIGVLAKGDDQVVLFSLIAMFIFSALGGTWFPLEISGGVFAAFGKLMPSMWAMTGLQNILIRGLGFASILAPTGILLVYALGIFGVAVWFFRKVVE